MRPLPGPASPTVPDPGQAAGPASRPGRAAHDRAGAAHGRDLTLLASLAVAVRLPALLASAHHHYDDGGYGLAVVAMRQGFLPFRDVFSSQGPLFLPLLRLGDLLGAQASFAPRLVPVAAGAATAVATYLAARELTDRGGALLAGALVATSGALLWTTAPITGDGVVAAFATAAVAVALAYRRDPTRARVVTLTLLAGAAVSVKHLMAGPALAVAWLVLLTTPHPHRVRRALLVPLGAAAVLVALGAVFGGHVVDHYFRYHLTKTGERDPLANLSKLATTLPQRDLPLLAVGAGALAASFRPGRRGGPSRSRPTPPGGRLAAFVAGERAVWCWAGLALALLVWQSPMFRNHLALLVAPLSILVAAHRPPWRWVAVLALAGATVAVPHLRPLLAPPGYRGAEAAVVADLRALPPGAWVLSDEPGLVWRAGRATDPWFVDPSVLRIRSSQPAIRIDAADVARAAADPRVCRVVVWAKVRFGSFRDLPAGLARLGYRPGETFGGGRVIYRRDPCRPPDPGGRAIAAARTGR